MAHSSTKTSGQIHRSRSQTFVAEVIMVLVEIALIIAIVTMLSYLSFIIIINSIPPWRRWWNNVIKVDDTTQLKELEKKQELLKSQVEIAKRIKKEEMDKMESIVKSTLTEEVVNE